MLTRPTSTAPTAPRPRRAGWIACLAVVAATMASAGTLGAQSAVPARYDSLRVGDIVVLDVTGVRQFSDTFQVREGHVLELPAVPPISLAGVRRSEVQKHLAKELARFVVNPEVRAHTLVRIGVVGAVEVPGFYAVRSDAPVADVLMRAGGLTREANPDKIVVKRRGKTLIDEKYLRTALATGLTVDRLALDGGDQLVVMERRRLDWMDILRNTAYVAGIAASLYAGRSLF